MKQYMNNCMCEVVTSAASISISCAGVKEDWQQFQHISKRNKAMSEHYVQCTHASGPLAYTKAAVALHS